MSEEKAIDILKNIICDEVIGTYCVNIQKEGVNCSENCKDEDCYLIQAIDLYNKEKEKNKELEEYANWHIEHLTEDIADFIDDDRIANASLIGELKEEREHWKDIIRISNNEKTYIDYKNY